jgi:hypothetical protein
VIIGNPLISIANASAKLSLGESKRRKGVGFEPTVPLCGIASFRIGQKIDQRYPVVRRTRQGADNEIEIRNCEAPDNSPLSSVLLYEH